MAALGAPAFRAGAALSRAVPGPVADAASTVIGRSIAQLPTRKRRVVERNLRRVRPELGRRALRRAVAQTFESYTRYYIESFRLPDVSAEDLDAGFSHEGLDHVTRAIDAGTGCIVALPHLGSWEWAGFWLTKVRGFGVTVVVERLDPPELFDWFVELRRGFGFEIVPLGPDAASACVRALSENRILCLLSDRDIAGGGVEVEFFGERTTLPGGPAVLALRTGAPLLPCSVYHRDGMIHGTVRPPLDTQRTGKLRDDVGRITQELARELEELIRRAPEQWHLMQPNWPSDQDLA